jgi:hypothetical protein
MQMTERQVSLKAVEAGIDWQDREPRQRRTWKLITIMTAALLLLGAHAPVRGDNLATNPRFDQNATYSPNATFSPAILRDNPGAGAVLTNSIIPPYPDGSAQAQSTAITVLLTGIGLMSLALLRRRSVKELRVVVLPINQDRPPKPYLY